MSNKHVITYVPTENVRPNPRQPSGRVEGNAQNVLRKSIQDIGLQYPPLATRDPEGETYTLVDGHRRLGAMRALGWESIPIIVATGNSDELFAAVSGTTQKMKAIQWAQVFVKGGQIPGGPTMTCLNNLKSMFGGMDFIERAIAAGTSPNIWNSAKRARKYMGIADSDQEALKEILEWLLSARATSSVSTWINGENSRHELQDAFRNCRKPQHFAEAA